MMKILDYSYYTDEYGGDMIADEREFDGLALKAAAFVNYITFGRACDLEVMGDDVKNAICAVCERMAEGGHSGVLSESNDGYSVTYAGSGRHHDLYDEAAMFLPAQMLYRGVDV